MLVSRFEKIKSETKLEQAVSAAMDVANHPLSTLWLSEILKYKLSAAGLGKWADYRNS